MKNLETYLLKRYCRKYGLDYQEVDGSLTYWENHQHLRSLVTMLCNSLDVFEIARMDEMQEEYIAKHPLEYYASFRDPRKPKRKPKHHVEDSTPRFSLKQMSAITNEFSLKTLLPSA